MAGGSSNFRDSILPALDAIRGIPSILGLRLHVAAIRTITWSGGRPGVGAPAILTTGLKVDFALANVKVRNVTQKEIVASGNLYKDQDLVIGPITPPFTGSTQDADAIAVFDPPIQQPATEVLFRIQGPGYSPGGDWFKKFAQRVDQPFRYMIWVRKTAYTINIGGQ